MNGWKDERIEGWMGGRLGRRVDQTGWMNGKITRWCVDMDIVSWQMLGSPWQTSIH